MHFILTVHFLHILSFKYDSIIGDTNAIMGDKHSDERNTSVNFICVDGTCCAREGYSEPGDQPPLQQVRTVLQPLEKKRQKIPSSRILCS